MILTSMFPPTNLTRNKGFTLIEAMISIAVGLVVLAGVIYFAAATLRANSDTLKSARLNQDLGAIMQIMVDDIRRAGYVRNPDPLDYPNPCPYNKAECTYKTEGEDINIVSSSCLLYSYDSNDSNTIEDSERYGFKVVSGQNQINIRRSCNPGSGTNCISDCSQGSWEALSDDNSKNVISITELTFSSTGSKCQETTAHDPDPTNPKPTSGKENNYWVTTGDTTDFPCLATTDTNLTYFVLNSDTPPKYDTGSGGFKSPTKGSNPPITSDRTSEMRQVNITLSGKIDQPAGIPDQNLTHSKRLKASVKVRNDRIRKHSS